MSLAELAQTVLDYSRERLELDPVPLDRTLTPAELQEQAGQTITSEGIGGQQAMDLFTEVLAPACLSVDHPRYLSFIPCAPTEAAAMFDLVVGASSIYAGSWLEGSGAVYAENQALRWIADLVGLPESAGGVFVPGGTIGMGIASGLATFWAALGVWVAVFPGTLEKLFGLFARLERPIDFEAMDGQPVDLVFLLLAPEGAGADHLKALAQVARVLREPGVAVLVDDVQLCPRRRDRHRQRGSPLAR